MIDDFLTLLLRPFRFYAAWPTWMLSYSTLVLPRGHSRWKFFLSFWFCKVFFWLSQELFLLHSLIQFFVTKRMTSALINLCGWLWLICRFIIHWFSNDFSGYKFFIINDVCKFPISAAVVNSQPPKINRLIIVLMF